MADRALTLSATLALNIAASKYEVQLNAVASNLKTFGKTLFPLSRPHRLHTAKAKPLDPIQN